MRIKKPQLSAVESRINRRSKAQRSWFSLVYASPPNEWFHIVFPAWLHVPLFPFSFRCCCHLLKKNSSLLIPACYFSSRFTICHKTEVVKNTLNPVWQPFTIPVRALCNGDYDRYALNPHVLHTSSSPQLLFILSLLHLAAFIMPLLPPHLHLKTLTSQCCLTLGLRVSACL